MSSILAFSGSSRKESFNKRLIKIAADGARRAGATVSCIDLVDYPMPIYNGDLEAAEGIPENGRAFKKLLTDHDGLLISSPEYNGAFRAYKGKAAAIMSASPGGLGGLRGLVHLRMLLTNLGLLVLPRQQAVPHANQAFAQSGALNDHKTQSQIEQLGAELVSTLNKLG